MNLLAFTIVTHLTTMSFKPLNLVKWISRTQTVETPAKPSQKAIAEAFGRAS